MNELLQLVKSNNKTMPLIASYKKHCESRFLELLQQGERRLRFAVKQCKVKTIVLNKELEKFTANVNTLNNLKEITNAINH